MKAPKLGKIRVKPPNTAKLTYLTHSNQDINPKTWRVYPTQLVTLKVYVENNDDTRIRDLEDWLEPKGKPEELKAES